MLDYLWALPRASRKAWLGAAAMAALSVVVCVQQWLHLHDDLAVARWVAWFFLVGTTFNLPGLLVVCVPGRLPRLWQRWPQRLRETLRQIHAEIAKEQSERRAGTRFL